MLEVGVELADYTRECARRGKKFQSAATILLAACAVYGLTAISGARAAPQDDGLSDLRSFVQGIASQPAAQDASIAALNEFVRSVDKTAASVKVADADNAIEALRDFFGAKTAPEKAQAQVPARKPAKAAKPVAAGYVGSKTCLGCHSTVVEQFRHTLMGRLEQQGKLSCEGCHGPGSEHARLGGGRGVGGIISFRPEDDSRTAEETNSICLSCHERGERTYWQGSVHQVRGLMCTNCHIIMKSVSRKNQLKTAFQPDTCFQCHKDRRAQMFRSSHMPLREGKVVCSDCHNPHGSVTEALLKKDSINDTCYTCHAEKRGPFLFEHLPVRENCDNCHDPHGTVNEFSLKLSRPRLCLECHGAGHPTVGTQGINATMTMARSCQNCHTFIHGTNSPAGGALQR